MPFIAIGLLGLFTAMLLSFIANVASSARFHDYEQRAMTVRKIAGGVLQDAMETGTLPASINALATTPGYEYLRLDTQRPWQGYAVSSTFNDGTWQYQRAVVYSQRPQVATNQATYLSTTSNACGTGAFNAAGPWCGSPNSWWWTWDTRSDYSNQISAERAAQRRLIQKFARVYEVVSNNKQVFPNPGSAGAAITSLLSGYTLSAATCTGVWLWKGVPLDCADLYSVWGTPRVYNYLSEDYIAVLATSPILDNNGVPVQVATQMDATVRLWNN